MDKNFKRTHHFVKEEKDIRWLSYLHDLGYLISFIGFPQVLGCVDGTFIRITMPPEHEVDYISRKGFHSLNVLVCQLIDARGVIKERTKHESLFVIFTFQSY